MYDKVATIPESRVLCRPTGGGPRLDRQARIHFGRVQFGEKHEKPTWNHEKPSKTNPEP